MKKQWYAIYTRSRCEKKVASLLHKHKIESYCPLNKVLRQWSDRKKIVDEPLFSGYVFVKINIDEQFVVKHLTSDIVNFVYWLGKPATIKDQEITNIKLFLSNHMNVKLEKQTVRVDDRVKILSGPLMDREGQIRSIHNNKVKLTLPSLGYTMVAETAIDNIQQVTPGYLTNRMVS